ncbi:unnamed protein product, partial [Musa textilis]
WGWQPAFCYRFGSAVADRRSALQTLCKRSCLLQPAELLFCKSLVGVWQISLLIFFVLIIVTVTLYLTSAI